MHLLENDSESSDKLREIILIGCSDLTNKTTTDLIMEEFVNNFLSLEPALWKSHERNRF